MATPAAAVHRTAKIHELGAADNVLTKDSSRSLESAHVNF
jgi:hypothetical protein